MLPVRSASDGSGLPDPTSAPDVGSREWSEAVRRTLLADRVVPGLRIPLCRRLSRPTWRRDARRPSPDERPDQALHAVAKAWTERTRSLGREHQPWHYRRSLNSLATLPHPPERGK